MNWTTRRRVEYRHCDPAGIVYYPRYFEMLHSVVEEYFRDHLGYDYREMHRELARAVTQSGVHIDFFAPGILGDELDFAVAPTKGGESALELEITCSGAGGVRFRASAKLVHTDLAARRRVAPWPDRIGARLKAGAGGDA